jgi:hypothetical protein
LPAAAVLMTWALSYLPGELFFRSEGGRLFLFSVDPVAAQYIFRPNNDPRPSAATQWGMLALAPPQNDVVRLQAPGFRFAAHPGPDGRFVELSIAYAWLLLPALLPLWWLRRFRTRQRRLERRLCVSCGYDLRHSAGRCPECGAVAAADPAVRVGESIG